MTYCCIFKSNICIECYKNLEVLHSSPELSCVSIIILFLFSIAEEVTLLQCIMLQVTGRMLLGIK